MESKFNSLSEWRKGEPIGYDMVKKFKMFPEIYKEFKKTFIVLFNCINKNKNVYL